MHRRRKKRAVLSPSSNSTNKTRQHAHVKVVEIVRGRQGFGFTISGQAPCLLSCITNNSPASRAGLKPGDCVMAVNGVDVTRSPHDDVVRLIGSCTGVLRLHIAPEAYYNANSSTSEEDLSRSRQHLSKPRSRGRPVKAERVERVVRDLQTGALFYPSDDSDAPEPEPVSPYAVMDIRPRVARRGPMPLPDPQAHSSARKTKREILRAYEEERNDRLKDMELEEEDNECWGLAQFQAVVGYLGTIEMPEDPSSSPSSGHGSSGANNSQAAAAARLAAIRSCVRRLRIEKKVHTLVLLRVWAWGVTLTGPAGRTLARYPGNRITFCGVYADDARFFGIVTSSHVANVSPECESDEDAPRLPASSSSSSCHVFMVDARLHPHSAHALRAQTLHLHCSNIDDPEGGCDEFPLNAEPILQAMVGFCRGPGEAHPAPAAGLVPPIQRIEPGGRGPGSISPQHSQHSHSNLSSNSSNSDSGIFRDDGRSSDRDALPLPVAMPVAVAVALPRANPNARDEAQTPPRPAITVVNNMPGSGAKLEDRLTVRAMPDPVKTSANNSPGKLFHLHGRASADFLQATQSPGELDNAAKLRQSLQRYFGYGGELSAAVAATHWQRPHPLLNPHGTHQHEVNWQSNVRPRASTTTPTCNMSLEDKLSPQVYGLNGRKAGLWLHPSTSNLNASSAANGALGLSRTPSDRSRVRSMEDLRTREANTTSMAPPLPPNSFNHSGSPKERPLSVVMLQSQAAVSNNGLDKLDNDHRDPPFKPVRRLFGDQPEVFVPRPGILQQPQPTSPTNDGDINDRGRKRSNSWRRIGQKRRSLKEHSKEGGAEAKGDMVGVAGSDGSSSAAFSSTSIPLLSAHAWATSFEKLLEQSEGLQAFAEFLKKEFSHENIYFWVACERYRKFADEITDVNADPDKESQQLNLARKMAQEIFERHVGLGASEPVNVDSQARQLAQDGLAQLDIRINLFALAQKQVFNLMKFDCFPRFLRSPLYKSCLHAQAQNLPLPFDLDPELTLSLEKCKENDKSKLKKSESDAGERRRRSLLPWPKKDRSKSKDRGEAEYRKGKRKNGGKDAQKNEESEKEEADMASDRSVKSELTGSRLSLSSTTGAGALSDSTLTRRAISKESVASAELSERWDSGWTQGGVALSKITLPDSATAVVVLKPNCTVRQIIQKMLDRRGLHFTAFDVFIGNSERPVDLESDATCLATSEVRLERRATFKLELPNKKLIGVKAKGEKPLQDVLRPILHKYGHRLDHVFVAETQNGDSVNLKAAINTVDGLRLQVSLKELSLTVPSALEKVGGKAMFPAATLEELTTRVLEDCMVNGEGGFDELGVLDLDAGTRSDHHDKHRLRKIGRRNSLHAEKDTKNKKDVELQGSDSSLNAKRSSLYENKPLKQLMPPPALPVPRKPILKAKIGKGIDDKALCEGLNRAQRYRLEDQRGTEINCELPEFLKVDYGESQEMTIDGRASEPIFGSRREVVTEPRLSSALAASSGFGAQFPDFAAFAQQILEEGLVPSPRHAQSYFQAGNPHPLPSGSIDLGMDRTTKKKPDGGNVAAKVSALEKRDKKPSMKPVASWDDLYLDLDIDLSRETDDHKQLRQQQQQQQQRRHVLPPNGDNLPLPTPPRPIGLLQPPGNQLATPKYSPPPPLAPLTLNLDLDLDDPLIVAQPPPPLPPKPRARPLTTQNGLPQPPIPPQKGGDAQIKMRNVVYRDGPSRMNVSFV